MERSGTSALGVRQRERWLAMTPHPSTLRVATFPSRGRQGVSRPRARATFAPGGKSSQKRRLDLRSKDPLARGETFLAGNFPTRPRRFFRFFLGQKDCASTASRVALSRAAGWCHGRGLCSTGFGDYQIAPKPPFGRLWVVYGSLAFPKGKTQQPR